MSEKENVSRTLDAPVGRIPSADEARGILVRFVNSHFRRTMKDCARFSIPARVDHDDDLLLGAFIDWHEAALNYYQAAFFETRPDFVPARVRLPVDVRGDGPYRNEVARAGEHECSCNQWGAIAVKAESGMPLGIKPRECEVVAWRKRQAANPPIDRRSEGSAER